MSEKLHKRMMKSRVFLSQVTEAFRKDTNTDHESAEGRLLWPGMLSASSFLIFRIDLQNLEAGPHPPLQKVDVEEAFKVCNSQELTVEANKDKRLIKKKMVLFTSHIHGTLEC